MYTKNSSLLVGILLVVGLIGWAQWAAATADSLPVANGLAIETVELGQADLATGQFANVLLDETGAITAVSTTPFTGHQYQSPAIRAPFPFNALVPRWQAHLPLGSEMIVQVRTGNGRFWSQWYEIHPHNDWTIPDSPQQIGDMLFVNGDTPTHTHLQFSLTFYSQPNGDPAPALQAIAFTFIDSSQGPTTADLLARQPASETNDGYPKPTIISRENWCEDPACFAEEPFPYYPVSHLILHHTATSNDDQEWAAVVRAIWGYHTIALGWGDIGYNFLVDKHGVIYEGRQGGDDVVGAHAGPANTGSMGVAMLGTFTLPDDNPPGIVPPAPLLNSVAHLFAWKADQRQIDVYDASRSLPNMSWGLPHLMSHRDIFGGVGTACPGDQAHALLPWLRDEVAYRLDFNSPYTYIDELSDQFTMSNTFWRVPEFGCGNNGHAFYAWSVTDPAQSHHWGEWQLDLPQNGRYELQVHIPYCYTGAAETYGADYTVTHAQGSSRVVVNQDARAGEWASLGSFDFMAGAGHLRLTNLTDTDTNQGVWFDGIRWQMVAPAVTLQTPPAYSWHNQLSLDFTWQITTPTSMTATRWQVATDYEFTDLVGDEVWQTAVLSHTHTFSQPYPALYWRVLLTPDPLTGLTEPVASPIYRFGFDQTAPESAVTQIYQVPASDTYLLHWHGQDDLSGIATYHIEYRPLDDAEADWTRWLTATTNTSALFTPPQPDQAYAFRSQATDHAGNIEPPHPHPDITTEQAILLPHVILLPIVKR